MNKVNPYIIFRDHIKTLYDDRTGKLSISDFATFYGLPICAAVAFYLWPFSLPSGLESSLVAIFSVFGALLFSAQIALYGLTPKKPKDLSDPIEQSKADSVFKRERKFFSDVNCNISYVIFLAWSALFIILALMVWCPSDRITGAVLAFVVSHFFLTLTMLIKRSHVAFSVRYDER